MQIKRKSNTFGPNSCSQSVKSSIKSNSSTPFYEGGRKNESSTPGGHYDEETPDLPSISPKSNNHLKIPKQLLGFGFKGVNPSRDVSNKQSMSSPNLSLTNSYGPIAVEKTCSKEIDGDTMSGLMHSFSIGHAFDYCRATRCKPWDNRELDVLDGFKVISFILCTIS